MITMDKFEQFRSLLIRDRSIRRFDESYQVSVGDLKKLVELTRYCASGRNLQPLAYRLVFDQNEAISVFSTLKWAGYLQNWDGPQIGERPTAYLVQCIDTRLASNCMCDDGLQLQAITLGANALGYGCCIIKSFNIPEIREILNIPDYYSPLYVIAIGKPIEEVEIVDCKDGINADIKYWRNDEGVHFVPKRTLDELII